MDIIGFILAAISVYYAFLAWIVFVMADGARMPWEGLALTAGSFACFLWSTRYWVTTASLWDRILP